MSERDSPQGLLGHLRRLAGHSALFGAADVASQVVNLLLTPLFVAYLSTTDMGALAVLFLLSALAKLVFRMGLDSGFLRVYYDQADDAARRALTGTVVLFAGVAGAALFGGLALVAAPLASWLLPGVADGATLVRLALLDVYVGSFLFVPLHLLRIAGEARRLALMLTVRNALNTGFKVALVTMGGGVAGVLVSDVAATGVLALLLWPVTRRHVQATLRAGLLRDVLAFGLPKAPHGVMVQLLNLADRKVLEQFHGLSVVGIYDKGYGVGAGVKFALSAFEPAWQPFVYSQAGRPEAPPMLARVATYAWAMFIAAGLVVAVFGRELLVALTFTNPSFWSGAPIVPVVVLAYLLHGAFLLTSIGIGIEKRTRYYPVITAAAAGANLAANYALIPRYGMMGAAWATVLGYAVMAASGFFFSQRVHPIPFEGGRWARLSAAGLGLFLLSRVDVGGLAATLAWKAGIVAAFPALLWLVGFWTPAEIARIRTLIRRN